jgi:hypothetical protein
MDKNLQKAAKYKKAFLYSLFGPLVIAALFFLQWLLLTLTGVVGGLFLQVMALLVLAILLAMIITFFLWIAALIANQAALKGRNWTTFFILSFFVPFIMWIVVSVISTDQSQPISGTKKCPKCAEYVKQEASLCKHCGSSI